MKLSQAELDTMLILWECEEPIRPSALLKKIEKTHSWSISTLKTILSRLEEKGLLVVILNKRFHYYSPKISKTKYFEMEAGDLISRLNTTSPVSLMAGLIDSDSITEEELDEIEKLLSEARKRLSAK